MRVRVFVTCLVDTFKPEIARAVVKLLESLDVEVVVPRAQTCCGQPAFNAGYVEEAKKAALHFIEVFDGDEPVVCPSGSCASMVKRNFPLLFEGDGELVERARRLGERTYELTQFLVRHLGVEGKRFRGTGSVTYHASCHTTRHLGVYEEPVGLLSGMEGVEFRPLPDATTCCGFGGLFMAKLPEISCALSEDKAAAIESTGADVVTGCDLGCLLNVEDALKRRNSSVKVKHIAELLSEGL